MTAADWNRARAAVTAEGLVVLLTAGDAESARAACAARALSAEVIALDAARAGSRAAAMRAAVAATTGGYVYLVDSAAEIERLPRFLAEVARTGADVVIGSKRHPESRVGYPVRRRFLSWVYYLSVRLVLGLKITDSRTGVRLFRRATLVYALDRALEKANAFDLELLAIAHGHGAKIVEAPIVDTAAPGEKPFGRLPVRTARTLVNDTLAVFYRARVLGYYAKCLVPKPLDHPVKVSVVIACPAPSWMLDECLAALAKQTYRNFEVIVLPDGMEGAERTGEAEGGRENVRFVPTGKVRPAEKRNLGIRAATGEVIAFIDDDAYPDAHWLEHAVRYFGEPTIGAVGGPGVTPPGDGFLARLGGRVYDNFLVSGNYRYRYKAGGVRKDVEDYPSCNLFVRKDLMDSFGGYRTDFWPGEDTLLCKDILDNWKRIIYDPWVIVHHHRRALFAPHLRQLGRYGFHRGYFCKRYPSNSLRPSYFVPTAFVAGFAVLPWVWPVYAFYLLLVLATTFSWKPHVWFLTALGVIASHVCYGVKFALGLCARRAPCEYIGKDHVGGSRPPL